jgi:peptide deformylase
VLDPDGKEITIETGKFLAKCIQQEIDNLNETLYIDHYGSAKCRLIDDKIKKVIKKLDCFKE